jgi:hypothetical protein
VPPTRRLAGMNHQIGHRFVVFGLFAVLAIGACSGAAAPSASPPPTTPGTPSPAPSDRPGSGGAGSSGDAGVTDPSSPIGGGIVDPAPVDPGLGQPKLVIARPGQLNPRPVGASLLEPAVEGRHVLVRVTWWSGVEPCNVLDSVKVDRSGTAITVQLIEGTGDATVACIEIAQQKATIVDLGELEPGTYTVSALGGGDATPVTVTVA